MLNSPLVNGSSLAPRLVVCQFDNKCATQQMIEGLRVERWDREGALSSGWRQTGPGSLVSLLAKVSH